MNNTETLWKQLQTLLNNDAPLLAQLQAASTPENACILLAEAAAKQGIVVSQAEIAAHFSTLAQTTRQESLSDEELDQVAGGYTPEHRYSILMTRQGGNCDKTAEQPWLSGNFDWGSNGGTPSPIYKFID